MLTKRETEAFETVIDAILKRTHTKEGYVATHPLATNLIDYMNAIMRE